MNNFNYSKANLLGEAKPERGANKKLSVEELKDNYAKALIEFYEFASQPKVEDAKKVYTELLKIAAISENCKACNGIGHDEISCPFLNSMEIAAKNGTNTVVMPYIDVLKKESWLKKRKSRLTQGQIAEVDKDCAVIIARLTGNRNAEN